MGKSTKKYSTNGFIIIFVTKLRSYMDKLSLIQSAVDPELKQFGKIFNDSLTSSNALLNKVLEHIRQRRGKMMRPVLVFLTSRLLGGNSNAQSVHAAVALELLHTASLVHDDVVDESDERRGQSSVNASYGNKIAVLSGDYMLATSLLQAGMTGNIGIIDIISTLGQELSDGEILQLSNVSNVSFSELTYFDVIRKKTAALFSACTKVAAMSVCATADRVEEARKFGEYVGICFQIRDDIFDYYDSAEVGKPTGIDMLEGKLTLPILYALIKFHDPTMKELAIKVKNGKATPEDAATLISYAKENGGIEYAERVMDDYKQRALQILQAFPDSPVRQALEAYVDYVSDRTK
jgi:octaprenyl-diphosphate synthase